jgi:hypothetical protein
MSPIRDATTAAPACDVPVERGDRPRADGACVERRRFCTRPLELALLALPLVCAAAFDSSVARTLPARALPALRVSPLDAPLTIEHQLPRVIGHRGAKTVAPENTLASILAAKACGCTWVEVDVMLTKDKVPVIHHDVSSLL